MRGLLTAFAAIWAVTAVGWLIGRSALLGSGGETVLARLVFFVAAPALLFATLATSDLDDIFTPALVVFVLSTLVVTVGALGLARFGWGWPASESVLAGLSAGYVNAANLGIPVAAYALGDISFVAPVLMFQVLFAAPLALLVLELDAARPDPGRRRGGPARALVGLPVRNPIMLASAAGLVLAAIGLAPPEQALRPFTLVGSAAVPVALLALGMSLSEGPRERAGHPAAVPAGSPAVAAGSGAVVPAAGSPAVAVAGVPGAGEVVADVSGAGAVVAGVPGPGAGAVVADVSGAGAGAGEVVAGASGTRPVAAPVAVRRGQLATLVGLKVIVQPALAYLIGEFGLGLSGRPLLAAVITSGLPTAQNVFVFATRYQRGVPLARATVAVTTVLTALTLGLIGLVLG